MAQRKVKVKMLVRSDTSEAWESKNPILDVGEIGYDTTNKLTKIGDGKTAWVDLEWFATETKPSFANDSWAQIAKFAESGKAADVYKVGDEKIVELSTGETITLVILGFNHDDKASGGKAGISIGMKNCLTTNYKMNETILNTNGWDGSIMRNATMATLLLQLPSDLQNVVKTVLKKATSGSGATTITISQDKLFLLSAIEIMSGDRVAELSVERNPDGFKDEGEQYEYWRTIKDGTFKGDRIKNAGDNGEAVVWYLRSPYVGYTNGFINVSRQGGVGVSGSSNNPFGVSFGFCV